MTKFIGYVGTYTKGDSKGIYTFTLDTDGQKLSTAKLAAELENPTYVTVSKDNIHLYAVVKQGDYGGAAAYAINGETGELSLKNTQVSAGPSPCHISVDSKKSNIVTATYHDGTVKSYQIEDEDGAISPAISAIQHEGSGPNKDRQEKAHAHYSGFTPDEKYVVVVDLGTDKLITYTLDNGQLTEVQSLAVNPGSGPRHLTFHPNGKYAYLMTELSNEIIVLAYHPEDGSFTEQQYISTIPEDFTENNQGSAIQISADGRFVYAANRGHDSIALFSINQETGELIFVERISTEGNWPRDFVLDPSGKFLVASNQESHNLVLYSRNEVTGKLTLLQADITVPYPVCVKFLNV
ncbi:lactonase family protein [Peribacillus cavernae]|uniref:Lactonase family protein n=1 Tax=Peribacillus cavernae TaxID=1674310 RepID=A0A3S0W9Y8_9BACI|nr:lactonase family protein [Peribacillus cavernae]MDQ0218799.1 6-phosphogluconolactonase [Peribacillus cavernae]RUQ31008.1 lactonase family protein [Peribacillus cavernae]